MKIARIPPPTPPPTFTMTFSREEGWTIAAALSYYADEHPEAVQKKLWWDWAADLDKKLRL
jgi:hypothetical protein